MEKCLLTIQHVSNTYYTNCHNASQNLKIFHNIKAKSTFYTISYTLLFIRTMHNQIRTCSSSFKSAQATEYSQHVISLQWNILRA